VEMETALTTQEEEAVHLRGRWVRDKLAHGERSKVPWTKALWTKALWTKDPVDKDTKSKKFRAHISTILPFSPPPPWLDHCSLLMHLVLVQLYSAAVYWTKN
jgi:hypothetical protein